jgi:hypothetical protein
MFRFSGSDTNFPRKVVIPAKAEVQGRRLSGCPRIECGRALDARFRGHDK